MPVQYYEGIGRRKESSARVRLMAGTGEFFINDKKIADYFGRFGDQHSILMPMVTTGENPAQYDVTVKVNGGGVSGQTEAVRLGLARALVKLNPEYISPLRKGGLLTRDPRVKERKKPGLKRARKAPTYTKR
jgi:small subunit ribosomal protein S9